MRVLMFGWELPPFISGGLGTACYGFTRALAQKNVQIVFVVPYWPEEQTHRFMRIVSASSNLVKGKLLKTIAMPYDSSQSYEARLQQYKRLAAGKGIFDQYGFSLFEEVQRMALAARLIAQSEQFDLIHCHDWMTFLAGIEAKKASQKPLILHVHTIEFDRTGGHGMNSWVVDLERRALREADRIVANSKYTKQNIIREYGISSEKIDVVHNAVEPEFASSRFVFKPYDRIVLFLARVTLQKGPEYFLYAAKKVLEKNPNVKFILAGTGDMLPRMIQLSIDLGIADNVIFTGKAQGEEVKKLYRMADVYVLPSVSEPFGITVLEAMASGTPTIVSKQCGLSQVMSHVLKVDFWDVNEMANKILALLEYPALHSTLKENGFSQALSFTWEKSAEDLIGVYRKVMPHG